MSGMSGVDAEGRERLAVLGEAVRKGTGMRVELGGLAFPLLTVEGRVRVACHRRPWHGPLHFCVPCDDGDGPCLAIGLGDQVHEVAGVVVRLVRS